MNTETAVVVNLILDIVALAPIILLARWAIANGQRDARRVEARDRQTARRRWIETQAESA